MRREGEGVVGLDLSLTSPAAVFIPYDWEPGSWRSISWWTRSFESPGFEDPAEGYRWNYRRILEITDEIVRFCHHWWPGMVAVEDYAYSQHSSSVTKLAELGGHVRVSILESLNLTPLPVPASAARKVLLGRVPRKGAKEAVQRALARHGAGFPNGDVCDAFSCANFALTEVGLTGLSLHDEPIDVDS